MVSNDSYTDDLLIESDNLLSGKSNEDDFVINCKNILNDDIDILLVIRLIKILSVYKINL